MEIEFLGTGTSQGVPVIACECSICTSSDIRNHRLRSSLLVRVTNQTIVIDTGPDFRQQMLRAKVKQLDAILLTHEHKDHIAGLDDIRPFNQLQQRSIHVYAEDIVEQALHREFSYIFAQQKYPGVPEIEIHRIDEHDFQVFDIPVIPIRVIHFKLPILGYRIGEMTYITDASYIPQSEISKIFGCKVLVINALRLEKHYSHFNLRDALDFIEKVQPQTAYLTHISHTMGLYNDVQAALPANVHLAYDGLKVII